MNDSNIELCASKRHVPRRRAGDRFAGPPPPATAYALLSAPSAERLRTQLKARVARARPRKSFSQPFGEARGRAALPPRAPPA